MSLLTPVLTLLLLTSLVCATDYYVSPKGDDKNDGQGISRPFQSFAHALSVLQAGDALWVMSGTYAESIEGSIPAGNAKNPIRIIAHDLEQKPVLKPTAAQKAEHAVRFGSLEPPHEAYVEFHGIRVDATHVQYDALKITNGAHHIQLKHCEFYNAPNMGVLITNEASRGNTISHNRFYDNGLSRDPLMEGSRHHLYIETGDNVVEHNTFGGSWPGWAIHKFGSGGNNIIRHNRVIGNFGNNRKNGPGPRTGDGIIIAGASKDQVYNNIVSNTGLGIRLANNQSRSLICMNTVTHCDIGILIEGAHNAISNNLISFSLGPSGDVQIDGDENLVDYNLSGGAIASNGAVGFVNNSNSTLAHNITSDPLLSAPQKGDFSLRPRSPAIDAGKDIGGITVDFNGKARRPGCYDIGALEFTP